MTSTLDARVRPVFRAVAETVAPRVRELDDEAWDRGVEIVEAALSERPPELRRQLRLFLRILDWAPVLRWGRRFRSLDPGPRRRLLELLQDAPVLLVRRGVWGLRTLALMACYGLPEVRREIGYRAHPRGWAARRARRGDAEADGVEPGPEVQL